MNKYPNKNFQPHLRRCRKVTYRTRQIAEAALENKQGEIGFDCIRAYPCAKCRGWHLTSQEKRVRDEA